MKDYAIWRVHASDGRRELEDESALLGEAERFARLDASLEGSGDSYQVVHHESGRLELALGPATRATAGQDLSAIS